MRRYLISPKCQYTQCPQYYLHCRQLPTEVHTSEINGINVDILFIGHGGGKQEQIVGLPFVDESGELFRRVVNHIGKKTPFSYAITNTIRACGIDENGCNREPFDDELDSCLPYLACDIDYLKPKIIVPLGLSALSIFKKDADAILTYRGMVISDNVWGTLLPTFHPESVMLISQRTSVFYNDIEKAVWIAQKRLIIPNSFAVKGESILLETVSEVRDLCDHLRHDLTSNDMVATDTETANLYKKYGNRIATIQFAHTIHTGYVIPLHHKDTPFTIDELHEVIGYLKVLFTEKVRFSYWLMHGAVFDIGRIYNELGILLSNVPVIDTMVMCYLLDENRSKALPKKQGIYNLKSVVREFFNFDEYDKGLMKKRSAGSLADLPLYGSGADSLVGYAGMDAYVTYRLFHYLNQVSLLQNYRGSLFKLLTSIYSNFNIALSIIDINGFKVDLRALRLLQSDNSSIWGRMYDIEEELKTFQTVCHANTIIYNNKVKYSQSTLYTPWVFDINTDFDKDILFRCVMKLKGLKKGKTDKPSYDKKWYEPLISTYPEIKLYAEYQGLKTLGSTYSNKIEKIIEPSNGYKDSFDGRMRGSFFMTRTLTGRLVSTDPNMQNMPRANTKPKRDIKNLFIADTINNIRYVLVEVDATTAEVRWWCLLSGDPNLAQAFIKANEYIKLYKKDPNPEYKRLAETYGDTHKVTASMMFDIDIKDITDDMRSATKAIVFGLIYGRTPRTLAQQLNKSIKEVEKLIALFFDKYPIGKKWLIDIEKHFRTHLYYDTIFCRRRRLPVFLHSDRTALHHAANQATNSPIQGASNDAVLTGTFLFNQYIIENNEPWRIMNMVHDSNIFEVPFDLDSLRRSLQVSEQMFTTATMNYISTNFNFNFICPLAVDFKIGFQWGSMMKWDGTEVHLEQVYEKLLSKC